MLGGRGGDRPRGRDPARQPFARARAGPRRPARHFSRGSVAPARRRRLPRHGHQLRGRVERDGLVGLAPAHRRRRLDRHGDDGHQPARRPRPARDHPHGPQRHRAQHHLPGAPGGAAAARGGARHRGRGHLRDRPRRHVDARQPLVRGHARPAAGRDRRPPHGRAAQARGGGAARGARARGAARRPRAPVRRVPRAGRRDAPAAVHHRPDHRRRGQRDRVVRRRRRHHRPAARAGGEGGARDGAAALAAHGVARPARRRRGARLQQPARRDPQLRGVRRRGDRLGSHRCCRRGRDRPRHPARRRPHAPAARLQPPRPSASGGGRRQSRRSGDATDARSHIG